MMFTLLVQTFSNGIIIANFYFQQDYIEHFLCENKETPELECHGHCFLNKELDKESKKEQNNSTIKKVEIHLYCEHAQISVSEEIYFTKVQNFTPLKTAIVEKSPQAVFQPPRTQFA